MTVKYLAGRDWRAHPELASAVFSAFRASKHVHELLLLLYEAAGLELSAALTARRRQLIACLEQTLDLDLETAAALDPSPYQQESYRFLRSLKDREPLRKKGWGHERETRAQPAHPAPTQARGLTRDGHKQLNSLVILEIDPGREKFRTLVDPDGADSSLEQEQGFGPSSNPRR